MKNNLENMFGKFIENMKVMKRGFFLTTAISALAISNVGCSNKSKTEAIDTTVKVGLEQSEKNDVDFIIPYSREYFKNKVNKKPSEELRELIENAIRNSALENVLDKHFTLKDKMDSLYLSSYQGDFLKDFSFEERKRFAEYYGITPYTGTIEQNRLLDEIAKMSPEMRKNPEVQNKIDEVNAISIVSKNEVETLVVPGLNETNRVENEAVNEIAGPNQNTVGNEITEEPTNSIPESTQTETTNKVINVGNSSSDKGHGSSTGGSGSSGNNPSGGNENSGGNKEPEKPTKPSEPEKPTEPSKPSEPEKPTEPSKPSEPEEPTKPEHKDHTFGSPIVIHMVDEKGVHRLITEKPCTCPDCNYVEKTDVEEKEVLLSTDIHGEHTGYENCKEITVTVDHNFVRNESLIVDHDENGNMITHSKFECDNPNCGFVHEGQMIVTKDVPQDDDDNVCSKTTEIDEEGNEVIITNKEHFFELQDPDNIFFDNYKCPHCGAHYSEPKDFEAHLLLEEEMLIEPEEVLEAVQDTYTSDETEPNENLEETEPKEGLEETEPKEGLEETEPKEGLEETEPNEGLEETESKEGLEETEPKEGLEETEPNEGLEETEPNEGLEETEPKEGLEETEPKEGLEETEPNEGLEETEPKEGLGVQETLNDAQAVREELEQALDALNNEKYERETTQELTLSIS